LEGGKNSGDNEKYLRRALFTKKSGRLKKEMTGHSHVSSANRAEGGGGKNLPQLGLLLNDRKGGRNRAPETKKDQEQSTSKAKEGRAIFSP